MIETFSIKEEKFINKYYSLNLGVAFNKKKIFNYLDTKNIFPSQIVEEKFLFIPIIIDQSNTDLLVFSKNLKSKINKIKIKVLLLNNYSYSFLASIIHS